MIQTTYYTNDEVIKAIMSLYEIDQFDLDCIFKRCFLEKYNTTNMENIYCPA